MMRQLRWRGLKLISVSLDFGDLPKKNPAASQAWLNGKIMGCFVNRGLHSEVFFFPL
jgi:hypothetical protein